MGDISALVDLLYQEHRSEVAKYQQQLQELQEQIQREREEAHRATRRLQETETKFLDQLTERDSGPAPDLNL